MLRFAISLASLVLLVSCATTPQISASARSDLTPTGKLRVGINFGNQLYVTKDPASGEARGIAVDLVHELGRRVGVPVEFVNYGGAGQMTAAAKTGAWDVAFFLAIDPGRESEVTFSAPTMEFDITYLVPAGSPLRTVADVDREGVRISVGAKSVYDLHLTRTLKRARLIREPGRLGYQLFAKDRLEAIAGPRTLLLTYAESLPGSRVLDGRIMKVDLAISTPKGRDAGARYISEFNEDVKASGMVAHAIERHGVRGVSVAPKSSVQ